MTGPTRGDHLAIEESIDPSGLFRAVLESMREAVFVVRPGDRVILMTNPAAGELFGVDPHSLVGQRTRVLYESDDAFDEFAAKSEEALEDDRSYSATHRFRRSDGRLFDAEVTTAPIDPETWSDGVVSVMRDVTDLHAVESHRTRLLHMLNERVKELQGLHRTATILADHETDLEELFQQVVDGLPAAWQYPDITVVRIEYRGIEVSSEGYCDTDWMLTEEFSGRDGRRGRLTVCYLEAPPHEEEEPFLDEERALLHSLAVLFSAHVQAREQREQAERERDRFVTLFRTSPIAMALSEPEDGRFVDVNDHWVELSGYSREELLGRTAVELGLWNVPTDREALKAELERQGGTLKGIDLSYRSGGVEPRSAIGSIQVIELDGRQLWFTTLLDRTAELRMEAEREHLQNQKEALARLGAIGELAGGVAHDFNNLLLPILINVELLASEATGDARARLEEIREAAVRGRDLTRKLLAFGRRTEPRKEAVDLDELVRSAEPILRRLVPESLELELDLGGSGTLVSADPTLLEQVLLNLVINASDSIDGRGSIRVRTSVRRVDADEALRLERTAPDFDTVAPGEYLYLEVEDDGRGIPQEVRGRIFEPFFTTKEESSGTGLGLASVLGIVKQHGGHLVLETEVGVGTSFGVALPVVEGAGGRRRQRRPPRARGEVGEGYRALVVEDHDAVRRATVRALEASGFTVAAVGDPQEALRELESDETDFDVVISDMVMPKMTGLELKRAMDERGLDLPVLFVSGYSGDVLSKHGVDRDTIPILEKPFTPDALTRAVLDTMEQGGFPA